MRRQSEPDGLLSFEEARLLLDEYGSGSSWIRHCYAVSDLAGYLAEVTATRHHLDIEFIRTASLLHDIGRYRTHDPVLHGVEGYRLLSRLGYEDEAFVCASHILYGLNRADALRYGLPERDFIPSSLEENLIPLADFLVEHDRPVLLHERFDSLRRRNHANADFFSKIEEAERKARAFMERLNDELGVDVEELASTFLGARKAG